MPAKVDTKKDDSPIEEPATPPKSKQQVSPSSPPHDRWNIGGIFWGLLLVIVGGLLLADNFDVVEVSWDGLWRLWPLALVAAGLSMLSVRNWMWRVITLLLVALTLAAVVFVSIGGYPGSNRLMSYEAAVEQVSSDITSANVSVKAGASSLSVTSAEQKNVVTAKLESNISRLVEKSSRKGDVQFTEFSMDGTDRWSFGDIRSKWDIVLTRSLPIDLAIDAGASDTTIDVSAVKLRSASIKAGASSVTLTVGNREPSANIAIDSGASSITIRVPKSSGVQLRLDGGLVSKNLADLNEVSQDTYESTGFSQSEKKIIITGKVGVASVTIERY